MGLQFSAKAYNVFVFSVLSFVSQLEDPPPVAFEREKIALTPLLQARIVGALCQTCGILTPLSALVSLFAACLAQPKPRNRGWLFGKQRQWVALSLQRKPHVSTGP